MIGIRLKQSAYAQGGLAQIGMIDLTVWYEAMAEDEDGNEYRVIWEVVEDDEDESVVCDWDNPVAILDEFGANVTGDYYVLED